MSKYSKEFAVPKEFPSVLKAFTREVLRAQPANIYEFGSQYFTELLAQAEAAQMGGDGTRRLSHEELEQLFQEMFHSADTDGSGALSPSEFKNVLKMADLGLSDKEIKRVYAEADFNGDGEISYEEFIPLAVDLVQNMYAKMDLEQQETDAREMAQQHLLHGMTKEEVEAVMMDIFMKSDTDGNGNLSRNEFMKCCKDADIGLTRKEINILMHQCDADGDGNISYEEFVPLCFEMLTEILKDQFLQEMRPPTELEAFLIERFNELDPQGSGMLNTTQLRDAIKQCDFGLTRLQIHGILANAEYDDDGFANYVKCAPVFSELIYKALDYDTQMERHDAINNLSQNFDTVHDLTADDVANHLMDSFMQHDTSGTGALPFNTVVHALQSSQMGFSDMEIKAMISAADMDDSGTVYYASLAQAAFYILQYIAQNAAISA